MKRRVVITGLGAITALGEGAGALWEAVLQGRSGIDFVDLGALPPSDFRLVGARIGDFDPEKFISQPKAIKIMARDIQLAVAGAKIALEDAQADLSSVDRERFGVIVGSGVLNHELDELAASVQSSIGPNGHLDFKKFGTDGLSSLFPLWLLKYLPNMPACHISILFDLEGPNNTLTTGASAGLQAVGEAWRIIERGAADLMLAGGAESKLNPVGLSQYELLGVLAHSSGEDPKKLYRPFSEGSKGLVVGEGAAFLVLEDLEHALRRNAKIYAEVLGFGSSSANGHAVSMKTALEEARLSSKELSYVQACGLGLPEEDAREAEAMEEVFDGRSADLCVSASKPVTGFCGFSAGAMDLLIGVLALDRQTIPPILNFTNPRRPWRFHFVRQKPLQKKLGAVMTNSFGFGGQCACLVAGVPPR